MRQLTQNRSFAIILTVRVAGATRSSHRCNFSELLVRPRRVAGVTWLSRWCDFSESLVRQCRPTGATFSPMPLSIETGAFSKRLHIWSKAVRTRAYPYYRPIQFPTFREKWEPESPASVTDVAISVSRPSAGNHPTPLTILVDRLELLGRPTWGTSVDRLGNFGRPTSALRSTGSANWVDRHR